MTGLDRTLGFLVAGAGFFGKRRAEAIAATPGARLVAVHDRDPDAARRVATRLGVEAIADYAEALGRHDVEAVVVATHHADHFGQALAALEAGKHVLCEKPLSVRPEDAYFLVRRADELGLRLATGLNHRFYPPVADALALTRDGRIGRVVFVRATIGHQADAAFFASWHADPARSGGGTLMDNGPHACDLVRQFLGEVAAADGTLRYDPALGLACEVEATAWFRGDAGGRAEVTSSWAQASGYLSLDVIGSDGWLRVETAPWRLSGVPRDGRRLRRGYVLERLAERGFQARRGGERSLVREVEEFIASHDHSLAADGRDGARATAMVEAVYRAAREGCEVHLPSISSRAAQVPLPLGRVT